MNDLIEVFCKLKEDTADPPADAFKAIWDQCKETDDYWTSTFGQLQEDEIIPGPALYKSVRDETAQSGIHEYSTKSNRKNTVLFFFIKYRVAAAIIVVAMTSALLIFIIPERQKNRKEAPLSVRENKIADSSSELVIAPGIFVEENKIISSPAKAAAHATFKDSGFIVSAGNYNFPVKDNDLLFTFSNFSHTQAISFLKYNEQDDLIINVDQFADISVSPNMKQVLTDLFSTTKKGKFTRKAKKTKRKLDQWRKDDIARFDSTFSNNPVDAIDLAKFILN